MADQVVISCCIASAERLGAPVFYTEDLNHNQHYGSIRAINPFLDN